MTRGKSEQFKLNPNQSEAKQKHLPGFCTLHHQATLASFRSRSRGRISTSTSTSYNQVKLPFSSRSLHHFTHHIDPAFR